MKAPGPFFVAITGGSCAGKNWLADRLRERLGAVAASISLDDFYRDRSQLTPEQREAVNFDHPDAIDWALFEQWMMSARTGGDSSLPRYDFQTHTRTASGLPWKPARVILVNGLWLLWKASIRELFDFSIFLGCPEDVRLERRQARDVAERGRTAAGAHRQFLDVVAPMHNTFVAPQARQADMVLIHPIGDAEVDCIMERLQAVLVEKGATQECRRAEEQWESGACSI